MLADLVVSELESLEIIGVLPFAELLCADPQALEIISKRVSAMHIKTIFVFRMVFTSLLQHYNTWLVYIVISSNK